MLTSVVGVTEFPVRAADSKSAATSKFTLTTTLTDSSVSGQNSTPIERLETHQGHQFFTNVNSRFAPGTPIRPEPLHPGGKRHEEFEASAS